MTLYNYYTTRKRKILPGFCELARIFFPEF